jgi:hypothetical protein
MSCTRVQAWLGYLIWIIKTPKTFKFIFFFIKFMTCFKFSLFCHVKWNKFALKFIYAFRILFFLTYENKNCKIYSI